jgi:hypothetical protein
MLRYQDKVGEEVEVYGEQWQLIDAVAGPA